jgi:cell wall-associated NlpC family hydrolase
MILAAGLFGLSLVAVGCRSAADARPNDRQQAHSKVGANERRSTGRASRVVAVALAQVGVPYRWGGADPRGFDCSGLVMYVYGRAGVSLPHGTAKQYRLGTPVSRKELVPGDIVFFDRLNHSGIYIGDGRFVHATKTGDTVKVSRLDEAWFERRWVGARRLPIADRQSQRDD